MVPNPSFETYSSCPTDFGDVIYSSTYSSFPYVSDWANPVNTAAGGGSTPDYYNSCDCSTCDMSTPTNALGYQVPRTGNAYVGLFMQDVAPVGYGGYTDPDWYGFHYSKFYAEYVECKLLHAMTAGHHYFASFFVSRADYDIMEAATDKIGAFFSDTFAYNPYDTTWFLPVSASFTSPAGTYYSDTVNWAEVSGLYLASGGEQWMTLGTSFFGTSPVPSSGDWPSLYFPYGFYDSSTKHGAAYTYYYIDDVCVVDLDSVSSSNIKDTSVCTGIYPYVLTDTGTAENYIWNTGDTTASISISSSGTYWRIAIKDCNAYVDTFHVSGGSDTAIRTDTATCLDPESMTLYAPGGYTTYAWSTGSSDSFIIVSTPGIYVVQCVNGCGTFTDTFNVTSTPHDTAYARHDTAVCLPLSLALTASAAATSYTWSDGSTGSSLTVADTGTYFVVCSDPCNVVIDTFHVHAAATAVISSVHNITVCGACDGTIIISGIPPLTADSARYQIGSVWQPTEPISSAADGTITLSGLCAGVYDSIEIAATGLCPAALGPVTLSNPPLSADFTFDTSRKGCKVDTVLFTNGSSGTGTLYYTWETGDGLTDTSLNPVHIYTASGDYTVTLFISNGHCSDSISKIVGIHFPPLEASFEPKTDSICIGRTVTFVNNTIGDAVSYMWLLGDGDSDTVANPLHTYTAAGVLNVVLTATDAFDCKDTAFGIVVVDTAGEIGMTNDSVLCQGQAADFDGIYAAWGNTGLKWSFGDGQVVTNEGTVRHAYDAPGIYAVTFTASYSACPDTSITHNVYVQAIPIINLGLDTSLCPGDASLTLTDATNAVNPDAHWLWSTGATSSSIVINGPDVYYTTVTIDGCSNSDTIWVKNDCYIDIPNAFTPNGDGVNDYFFPRPLLADGLTAFTMDIYNRWGQLIFHTDNTEGRGWDGKFNGMPQMEGVYVYLITGAFRNGIKFHRQGNVTLIR